MAGFFDKAAEILGDVEKTAKSIPTSDPQRRDQAVDYLKDKLTTGALGAGAMAASKAAPDATQMMMDLPSRIGDMVPGRLPEGLDFNFQGPTRAEVNYQVPMSAGLLNAQMGINSGGVTPSIGYTLPTSMGTFTAGVQAQQPFNTVPDLGTIFDRVRFNLGFGAKF